jgi:hypothetical protein
MLGMKMHLNQENKSRARLRETAGGGGRELRTQPRQYAFVLGRSGPWAIRVMNTV